MTLSLQTGAMRTKARVVFCAIWILAALLCAAWPAGAASPADLAGPLRDIAAKDAAGQFSPADPLARLIGVRGRRIEVEILVNGPASAQLGAARRLRADIRRHRDRRIQAIVPIDRLVDIASLPSVAQVRLPDRALPLQIPPTVSEGVQLTNALSLQIGGITGLGASIAVIDAGFLGYTTAELPTTISVRSFRSDGIIDGITDHGTAVAEIVGDMAPEVEMYLLSVDTSMDTGAALEWCLQNDIDIVNMSLGWLVGPFDGTHSLDTVVDRVRAGGVLPVISCGNFAQRHWAGEFLDTDADGLHEFGAADQGAGIITVGANETVQVHLSWYQTASPMGTKAEVTDRDYDIELVDGTGQTIARSAVTQNGDDPPSETLLAMAPTPGSYDLQIRAVSSNIPTGPTDQLQFFVWTQDIDSVLQIPETSLSIPGTASGSLAVAATRAVAQLNIPGVVDYPVDTLEPFSSHGPTVDGRQKPDMAAPDAVQTSTTLSPFFGTSAASPHVAGGAALLKSEDATRSADELHNVLVRLAADQNLISPVLLADSTPATVEQAGAGRLSLRSGLDTKPPAISITFPVNGTTITTAMPTIVGVITDTETRVDPATIVMTLDGVDVPWDSFNPGSGVVTLAVTTPLSRSAHTVTLAATDNAGNVGTPAVSNFRVGLPTLSAGLHLISLPYRNLVNTDPAAIFGVAISDLGLVRWVALDPAFNKYRVFPDPLASFEPPDALGANPIVNSPPAGLGYWVKLPREVILNVAGQALSDVSSYTIRLPFGTSEPTGWHMIGNPFQDSVDWSTVQFVTSGVRQDLDDAIASGVTEGIVFEYSPTDGTYEFVTPLSAVLKPMKGYWLHVRTSTEVIIYPATVATARASKRAREEKTTPALDNWKLQLIASAPGLLDRCNYLGVAPNASSGHDVAGDVPEPPPIGKSLRLYFPHTNWGAANGEYTQDLRARSSGKQEWEFDVACPKKGAHIALSWPELNATVPGELSLRLHDLDNGRSVYMRTVSSYRCRASAPVRHFKVSVDRAGAAGLQIMALAANQVRDGNVVVTYEVNTPASITAEVRNIAGRPIRRLIAGRDVGPGIQTLAWNGRSNAGSRVPSGIYFLHLSAKAADGQAVQRICPINAAR